VPPHDHVDTDAASGVGRQRSSDPFFRLTSRPFHLSPKIVKRRHRPTPTRENRGSSAGRCLSTSQHKKSLLKVRWLTGKERSGANSNNLERAR